VHRHSVCEMFWWASELVVDGLHRLGIVPVPPQHMITPHNENNKAGIASKRVTDAIWAEMPKGSIKVNRFARELAKSRPTDWTQTGNLTLRNANGSLDTNPKSIIYSNFNLND
jgi:hypothetical protein